MLKDSLLKELIERLSGLGFFLASESNDLSREIYFNGYLDGETGYERCRILVSKNFDRPPVCEIKNKSLFGKIPHLNKEGIFCYCREKEIVFDVNEPIEQIVYFVRLAQSQWREYSFKRETREIGAEISAYWREDNEALVLFDCDKDVNIKPILLEGKSEGVDNENNCRILLLSQFPDRTLKCLNVIQAYRNLKWNIVGRLKPYIIFVDAVPCKLSNPWPPIAIPAFLKWLGTFASGKAKGLKKCILSLSNCGLLIVIRFKNGQDIACLYCLNNGMGVDGDRLNWKYGKIEIARLIDVSCRGTQNINDGERFLLKDKRIVLVGCGTIGGYIADGLISSGAGSGSGELILIDNDRLSLRNIGRHRLGCEYIGLNKAESLAKEMRKKNPAANVKWINNSILEANFNIPDILVDATGEEALGCLISQRYHNVCDVLSTWIESNGVVIRSFLHEKGSIGCYSCLCKHIREGKFKVLKNPPTDVLKGGCSDVFTPFSVCSSMSAASLALSVIFSWEIGSKKTKLYSQILDSRYNPVQGNNFFSDEHLCPLCLALKIKSGNVLVENFVSSYSY